MNYIELVDDLMNFIGGGFHLDNVAIRYSQTLTANMDLSYAHVEVTLIPEMPCEYPLDKLVRLDRFLSQSTDRWVKTEATLFDITQQMMKSPLWTTTNGIVEPGEFRWGSVAATFCLRRTGRVRD